MNYPGIQKRLKRTCKFIGTCIGHPEMPFLDIGPDNDFGRKIAKIYEVPYNWIDGDLNDVWQPVYAEKFKTVICFEVIEHLTNPVGFLKQLSELLDDDAVVVISYPIHIHPYLWSETHFHEYDKKRFEHIVQSTGYKIEAHDRYFMWPQITGIRPALRLLKPHWICWQNFYLLKWSE